MSKIKIYIYALLNNKDNQITKLIIYKIIIKDNQSNRTKNNKSNN